MRGARIVGCFVLAGCLGQPPREQTHVQEMAFAGSIPSRRVILGGHVDLHAMWSDTCTKTDIGAILRDKYGDPLGTKSKTYYTCNEQSFHLETTCDHECEPDTSADATMVGTGSVRVRVLELGKTRITVDVINDANGEMRRQELIAEVVLPDTFEVLCMSPRVRAYVACAKDGLDAANPMLRVIPKISGWASPTKELRLDGKAAPKNTYFTNGVSLAVFFPDARIGDGIAPGNYAFELSVGDKREQVTLEAVARPAN